MSGLDDSGGLDYDGEMERRADEERERCVEEIAEAAESVAMVEDLARQRAAGTIGEAGHVA